MGVAYPVLTGAEVLAEINKVLTNTTNKITDVRALALDHLDVDISSGATPAFKWSVVDVDNFLNVAGTWARDALANNYEKFTMRNVATHAINDAICIGHMTILATGNYTLHLKTMDGLHQGIIHVMLNNVDKGTIDCYAGSAAYNVIKSVSLGSLTKGVYAVVLKMASKNASADDYYGYFEYVTIMKT